MVILVEVSTSKLRMDPACETAGQEAVETRGPQEMRFDVALVFEWMRRGR